MRSNRASLGPFLLRRRSRAMLSARLSDQGAIMRIHKARERLRWRGTETVREIAKRLNRHEPTIVLLPHGLHHAVCVRTGADERSHGLAELTLDAESFERLTRITALHELEPLREHFNRGAMNIRLRTPPPQLIFVPRDTAGKEPMHQHHWSPTAAFAL